MLKVILLVLALLGATFAAYVALQPAEFKISRSAVIDAPASKVFAQVNDFHQWEAWSPWAKLDPNSKATYEGPAAGVGASFAWAGNNQVGEGRMTITESKPVERILINLEFLKPMKATSLTEFTFTPEAGQTRVTWTMSGRNNFIGKAMNLVMNCDKMVGGYFEKGLTQMKAVAEKTKQV